MSPFKSDESERLPAAPAARARWCFDRAAEDERGGRTTEAERGYLTAAEWARSAAVAELEAEALSRFAVIKHHQGQPEVARQAGLQSLAAARSAPDRATEAQTLNVLAGLSLDRGDLDDARKLFDEALTLAAHREDLRAKIEQNLGIVANVQGDWGLAESHYRRALEIYRRLGDWRGEAMTCHNLGMMSADHREYARAEQYFSEAMALARLLHDSRLEGLCLLNRGEILVARQAYTHAEHDVEAARAIFVGLGSVVEEADCRRVLGAIYAHTGNPERALVHLTAAINLAIDAEIPLTEAEAWRELGYFRAGQGRVDEAYQALEEAVALFDRLGARHEVAEVSRRLSELA